MKQSLIYSLIFLLILSCVSFSATDGGYYGAVLKNEGVADFVASGRCYTSNSNGIAYIYANPAGIFESEKIDVSMTYGKPFSELDDASQGSIDAVIPLKNIAFGLSYSYFKIDNFRESIDDELTGNTFNTKFETLRLSISDKRVRKYSFGAQFKLFKNSLYKYNFNNKAIDIGTLYKNKDLLLSLYIKNILSSKTTAKIEKEKLPLTIETGINYSFLNLFSGTLILVNDEDSNFDFKLGLDYRLSKIFVLKAGYVNDSKQISGGLSVKAKWLDLHYAFRTHSELSLSHKVTIQISDLF